MALFDGEVALFLSHGRPPSLGAGASYDMKEQYQALQKVGMVRTCPTCVLGKEMRGVACAEVKDSTTWPWSNQPVAILLVLRGENRV